MTFGRCREPEARWEIPSPPTGQFRADWQHSLHGVYSGTAYRKIYVNGAEVNSAAPINAVPAGLDTLRIFAEDGSSHASFLAGPPRACR